MTPFVILIEDSPHDQALMRLRLEERGCMVAIIPDLFDADTQLRSLIETHGTGHPILMLVDQQMTFQGSDSVVDGWALMATAMDWMLQGQIPPVLMVAVSADLTEERHHFARSAGTYEAIEKPILDPVLDRLLTVASDGLTAASIVNRHREAERTSDGAALRSARSFGQRLFQNLKRLVVRPKPNIRITPKQAEILFDPLHPEHRMVLDMLGGGDFVLPRFQAALNRIYHDKRREYGPIIDGLQRRMQRNSLGRELNVSRSTLYRHVDDLFQDLANAFNNAPPPPQT